MIHLIEEQTFVFKNGKETDDNNQDGKLVEEEAALIGRVRWSIYLNYFQKIGPWTCVLICKYRIVTSILSDNTYKRAMQCDSPANM